MPQRLQRMSQLTWDATNMHMPRISTFLEVHNCENKETPYQTSLTRESLGYINILSCHSLLDTAC